MVLRVFLWIVLAYFLYRFIFNFLLPVITVSRRMKQGVREFQRQQAQQQQDQNGQSSATGKTQPAPQQKAGEYIDFEEIKK